MKGILHGSVLALGMVLAWPAAGSGSAAKELPKAEDILDRAAEATGAKASPKIETAFLKMKKSAQDTEAHLVVYYAGPTKFYREECVEGLGKFELVVSGELAWTRDTITGSRLLKDEERAEAFHIAKNFGAIIQQGSDWRKRVKEAKTIAEEKVEGKLAYKIQVTTPQGETQIEFYDKESGLLVREETTVRSPQGEVRTITSYSDYRKVGGMVVPFTTRVVEGSAEVIITVEQAEYNMGVPQERFTLPGELQKVPVKQ